MKRKSKILVLFCGGTIVMVANREGQLVPPGKEMALHSISCLEPKIHDLADLDVHFISNIDSSDMTPALWDQMAEAIEENYEKYDAFILAHGTDTMAYTASALSFSLENLGKPVILTGSQIPGHHLESDARRNFVNAVKVALMDLSGVYIVFGDKIIAGTRASKFSHSKLDAFTSVNVPSIGEIRTRIRMNFEIPPRKKGGLQLEKGFDPRVAVLSLVPGMPVQMLDHFLQEGVRGMVITAYGSGNIPHDYLPFLKKAQQKELPVAIRTQCWEGGTEMALYDSGQLALQCNAIEAYDMSRETTIVKLMWALKRGVGYREIKTIMHKNYVGEISFKG